MDRFRLKKLSNALQVLGYIPSVEDMLKFPTDKAMKENFDQQVQCWVA